MEIKKTEVNFLSFDGKSTISAAYYFDKSVVKIGVLQIAHGMCEYKERYENFINFMASKGFIVCISDHLGHGKSSIPENYGYFAEENGAECVLQDIHTLNEKMRSTFPKLKIFLLGHSMGSFFARWFAQRYPKNIDGVIFMGTGGPNPAAGAGIQIAKLIGKVKGKHYRSQFINNMAFGSYIKTIDNPQTPYDWISRDEKIVQKYASDPACTFIFTVGGYQDMLSVLKDVNTISWAESIPKSMPILLLSGKEDPVGNFGKGVTEVYQMLKNAGVEDVTLTLYEGMRHEPLNEIGKEDVYKNVANWLLSLADPYMECICKHRTIRRSRKCGHCSF